MLWNQHSMEENSHAFLSASKYHWINYDEEKLVNVYSKYRAAQKGTELHELAARLIHLGVKLPKTNKTLNLYVNDAIGYKMSTEVTLYYSENCFGTADAICFRKIGNRMLLRIHDLKTGMTAASIKQLEIYAALFCLEYMEDPQDIDCELRIYQHDEVLVHEPEADELLYIMQKIKDFDKKIKDMKQGE